MLSMSNVSMLLGLAELWAWGWLSAPHMQVFLVAAGVGCGNVAFCCPGGSQV